MDGLKRRLSESVQLKLSITISVAILVLAVGAGVLSFLSAFDEAHELQDDVLRQVAQLMDRQRSAPARPGADIIPRDDDEESRVIVQGLGEGMPSSASLDAGGYLALPNTLEDGLHTLEVGGSTFRVMVKTTGTGGRIAVSQESRFRNRIARDSALRTVMPFLVLVPALVWLVADLVRKLFQPIAALSREIDQRAEHDLRPVEVGRLPIEVRPFVVAINRLLDRVDRAMGRERRFVADAAHELRSPLTAISLQAERLAAADMSSQAHEHLATLREGIERGRSLVNQLLTLAKAQSPAQAPKMPVSIQAIYRRVMEDCMPLVEARHIDIGVEGMQDMHVWASELDMITLVKNLVDNAIRYTPDGGRVDLSVNVTEEHAILGIRDTGPGIPLAERDRVFTPFYRTLGNEQIGSGLGLAIVKTLAMRIGADIVLGFSDEAAQTGLSVDVLIRRTQPPEAGDLQPT